jgi:uncharacterized protein (TIGR03435 family)
MKPGAAAICIFLCAIAYGQLTPERSLNFEVASVKTKNPDVIEEVDLVASGERLTATNLSLQMLLAAAYGLEIHQVAGGPAWVTTDRFNILAKAQEDVAREEDRVTVFGRQVPRRMMLMLQALLTDRFRLRVHREMKESTTYDLVIAKAGSRLRETANGDQAPYLSLRQSPSDRSLFLLDGRRASMELLAERLNRFVLHAPVTNRTGLNGEFDFKLEYSPNLLQTDAGPSVFTAIQEQLGLRLEPKKGYMDTLVVDQAEKPSEN